MEASLPVQKCRSLEEDLYWKLFKIIHFFCILPDNFHDRLVLPQKFAGNMILDLPNKVPLFGPSGGAKWDVTLMKTKNVVAIVGDGWKEFVKAYALEATYLLTFKYEKSKGFEVLIFDPETCCEKEAGYFVKNDKPTINSNNNNNDQQNKRSSAEAFATSTEVLEFDEDNFDDSEIVTSKRVRKDTEDPMWSGEANLETVQSLKPNETAGLQVRTSNNAQIGEEQLVLENRESGLELGCSNQSSETRGKKQNGNESSEEQISPEIGEGNLETVQSPKSNEIAGKTNGSELAKELNIPQNGGSILEFFRRLRCYETINRDDILGKKQNRNEGAVEHISPETGEGNLETVQSPKPIETAGKMYGSERVKELNIQEKRGSILKFVHHPKCYENRGTTPNDSPEVDGGTTGMHVCKSRMGRGRPKKQSALSKNNLVYENDLLGDKSNMDEAESEQNGCDTGASILEMVSCRTRGRSRSKLKLESGGSRHREGAKKKWLVASYSAKKYASKRRRVTKQEKENALQRAERAQRAEKDPSVKSFIVVMLRSAVYSWFYLSIPANWAREFLPCQREEVILRMGDKTWHASFYYYPKRGAAVAGGGWKKFVIDNRLKEFDVCMFKLVSQNGDVPIIFDVEIFSVVPETVSPTFRVPFQLA